MPEVLFGKFGSLLLLQGAIIDGRTAVTIVDAAAPPILKNSLASNNWGNTFLACTKSKRAKPMIV